MSHRRPTVAARGAAARPVEPSEELVAAADPRGGAHRVLLLSPLAERYLCGDVAPEVYFAAVDRVARRAVERELERAAAQRHRELRRSGWRPWRRCGFS